MNHIEMISALIAFLSLLVGMIKISRDILMGITEMQKDLRKRIDYVFESFDSKIDSLRDRLTVLETKINQ